MLSSSTWRPLLAAVVLCAGYASTRGAPGGEPNSPFVQPGVEPYCVQLHAHGPFSEGVESLDTGTWEAHLLDLDAVWWSDHDWRIQYYRHVSTFSFDDWSVAVASEEPWDPNNQEEAEAVKGLEMRRVPGSFLFAEAEIVTGTQAYEGSGALRLAGASSRSTFDRYGGYLGSAQQRHKRSLASGVTLEVAILPAQIADGARPFVEVTLSRHVPLPGSAYYSHHRLHYFLSKEPGPPFRVGYTLFVPVGYTRGQWTLHEFDLTTDAMLGFPLSNGEDNVLSEIAVGIETRAGRVAEAYFDALRITHNASGEALMAKQRTMLAEHEAKLPKVRHHQGVEISYWRHLNAFSLDAPLYDYDQLVRESGFADGNGWVENTDGLRDYIARRVVDDVHARGGLVSYNHMLGTSDVQKVELGPVRDRLLQNRVFGCDLLEVGYRSRGGFALADHLWVWDELMKAGLFLAGTGVSDSHGADEIGNWGRDENNFVTWIYADSIEKDDLIAGMRGARAYFGDPTLFSGAVDVQTGDGHLMGAIVVTDKSFEDLQVAVDGLVAGDSIVAVRSGEVLLTEVARRERELLDLRVDLGGEKGSFYRLEVYDAAGAAKVFSNPVAFVRIVPQKGIPAERAAISLGPIRSRSFTDFHLEEAVAGEEAGGRVLRLRGTASGGRIVLDLSRVTGAVSVTFGSGIQGTFVLHGGDLELSSLSGSGAIEIRH